MSDTVIQSIITGLVAIVLAWIAFKQAQLHSAVLKIKEDVNGHTRLLLEATKGEAVAVGKAAGIAQERARTDLATQAVEPNDKGHAHE